MKKHIPNTITCCNLISGCIATYFAFQANFQLAFTFIIIGAVFDFFDGFAARLLHVSSPVGKELDSLADDITFGGRWAGRRGISSISVGSAVMTPCERR